MILLIYRTDFDGMENREPITRRVLGYVTSSLAALDAIQGLIEKTPRYEGHEGGWGGEKCSYPIFTAISVEELKPL